MHVSLDGFVAGPAGEMDWIRIDDELFDYARARTEEADTALYARRTFELMDGYWPTAADKPNATKHDKEHAAWYNKVDKFVVSRSWQGKTLSNATLLSNPMEEAINRLKQGHGKEIVMFGSRSLGQQLAAENLIDDYWLFVNPVLLGKGLPLFGPASNRIDLRLTGSTTFRSGVIGLHYEK